MADNGNSNLSIDDIIQYKKALEELIEKDEILNDKTARKLQDLIELYNNNFDKKREDLEGILRTNENLRLIFQDMGSVFQQQYDNLKSISDLVNNICDSYGLEKDVVKEILPLYKEWVDISEKKVNLERNFENLSENELEILEQITEIEKKKKAELLSTHEGQVLYNDSLNNTKNIVNEIFKLQKELRKLQKDDGQKELKNELNQVKEREKFEKEKNSWRTGYKTIDAFNFKGQYLSKSEDEEDLIHRKNHIAILESFWNVAKKVFLEGFEKWREIDQMTRDFGRRLGMNHKQLDDFRGHTLDSYGKIANTLGMTSKDIFKFQEQFSENTQKAIMLTEDQLTSIAGLSRYVGGEAISLAEQNLDVLTGANADATVDYLAKGMAKATREGLHIKAYSEAFAKNIKLASKYNFKDGINGIQRMTLLTQRLKVDMASIVSAMDKFGSIESSIETGAQIQVLGGTFANNFGNPMQAMAESLLDPEAFTQRIINTVSPLVSFNSETGEYELSPADKLRLNAFAKSIGMDYQEVFNMATQEHKLNQIQSSVNNANFEESEWNYIANKAQYSTENGWVIRDHKGEEHSVQELAKNKELLSDIRNTDETDKLIATRIDGIHEILAKKFGDDVSFNEEVEGWMESFKLNFANFIDGFMGISGGIAMLVAANKFTGGVSAMGNMLGGLRGNNPSGEVLSGGDTARRGVKNIKDAYRTQKKYFNISRTGRAVSKASGILNVGLAVYDTAKAFNEHGDRKDEILQNSTLSRSEKAKAIQESEKERNKGVVGALGGAAGAWAGAKAGATLGAFGGVPGMLIGGALGGVLGYFGGNKLGSELGGLFKTNGEDDVQEFEKGKAKVASANNKNLNNIEDDVHYIASAMSAQRSNNNQVYSSNNIKHSEVYNSNGYLSSNNSMNIDFNKIQVGVSGKIDLQTPHSGNFKVEADKWLKMPSVQKEIADIVSTQVKLGINAGVRENKHNTKPDTSLV